MFTIKRTQIITVLSAILFLFMITMNALAVLLPLNGLSTAMISSRYDTLFAPTGFTFSIWGVIYLGLGMEVLLTLLRIKNIKDDFTNRQKFITTALFSLTSLLNGIWIVFWHYELLLLSLITMLLLFGLLLMINLQLKKASIIDRLPFSLYFGWITVALTANIAAFIVSLGVSFNNVEAVLQTSVIIIVVAMISCLVTIFQRDFAYGLVAVWALIGIVVRHFDVNQFNYGYRAVANSAIIALVLVSGTLIAMAIITIVRKWRLT